MGRIAVDATASTKSVPAGAFVDSDGVVTVLYSNGSTRSLGVTATIVGAMKNLDDDRYLEVPFTTSDGDLKLVDTQGEVQTLVSGNVKNSKRLLPTGDWNDDGENAVFYENGSGKLRRVEFGEQPQPVLGPNGDPIATNGPVGLADYDADGDEDLVFLGSSSTAKYYDGNGSDEDGIESTGFSSFGSNNGLGIGPPADFDGDGVPRIPYVTGSQNLALLAADGTKTKLNTSYQAAAKAPVAAGNWEDDPKLEILHVNTDNDNLYYGNLNGTVDPVRNASGGKISATVGAGIAPAAVPPAPDITDYSVTNPTGREIAVSFNSSDELVHIAVKVDGPSDVTLTEDDFSESGSGPYHYEATWTAPEDGNYTATLTVAEDAQGTDGATNESGSVAIETPYPTVSNVTIVDASDGNGVVAGGDEVRVTATVTNSSELVSVVADAAAFGAGNVSLTHVSGDRYAATFSVDASDVPADGETDLTVTARNEYDHADTNTSGTLFVDTTPPTADAGPNVTIDEDTSVQFDGDGSTDNGEITAYVWTFENGSTATGITASKHYDTPGNYTVTLTVTDAANHTDSDTLTVRVTDESVDNPPTADAGPNVTVVAGSTVTLDGDGSTDDNGITEYTWTLANGSTVTGKTIDRTYADPGNYTLTLTVTDTAGQTDSDTITVHVTESTFDADAGPNATVEAGATVVFDGDGSIGNITEYTWTFPDGTTATGVTVGHEFTDPGEYTVTLTVTAADGRTDSDTVTVDVVASDGGGSGGGGETGGTTSGSTSILTNVTDGGDVVTVTGTDVPAGNRVTVSVADQVTVDEAAVVEGVTFVVRESGRFRLTIDHLDGPPSGVERLENRPDLNVTGYFRVTHSDVDLRSVGFTVAVPKTGVSAGEDAVVRIYRYHDGRWIGFDAIRVGETARALRYHATVPGTSVFAVVVAHADIRIGDPTLVTSTVRAGESAVVQTTVENVGAARGTRNVSLVVNGTAVATKTVTLAPNETRTVTFARRFREPGRYRIEVDDATAGTLSVVAPSPTATPTPAPTQVASRTPVTIRSDPGTGQSPKSNHLPLPWLAGGVSLLLVGAGAVGYRRYT